MGECSNYLCPTISSSFTKYQCSETDLIKSSFQRNPVYNLRQLPSKIVPGNVDGQRRLRITENLLVSAEHPYQAPVQIYPLFGAMKHQYNDFGKETELNRCLIEEERVKVDMWNRKPFNTSFGVRLKHENLFGEGNYKYCNSKGIEATKEKESDKFLYGEFHNCVRKDKESSKADTKQWTKQIFEVLSRDWPHLKFKVKFTDADELLICFPHMQHNDENNTSFSLPIEAINRYMNNLVCHGVAGDLKLKKKGTRWKAVEFDATASDMDDPRIIVFAFLAPWVKRNRS